MPTYAPAAATGLDFGDICVGRFFADVRVDRSTEAVYPWKEGGAVVKEAIWRKNSRRPNRLVVTLGELADRAIVVSDGCAVETAIGRGSVPARGRIWFAPLRELKTAGALQEARSASDAFGRLLLEPDVSKDNAWVVELQRAFPAEATAVRYALEADRSAFVVSGIQPGVAYELRARWAAYACRCGPFVARDNASHLMDRLEASGLATDKVQTAANALLKVATSAWIFEGSSLESSGSPEATPERLGDDVAAMVGELSTLRDAADDAIALLVATNR